jgi:hypothetical protein
MGYSFFLFSTSLSAFGQAKRAPERAILTPIIRQIDLSSIRDTPHLFIGSFPTEEDCWKGDHSPARCTPPRRSMCQFQPPPILDSHSHTPYSRQLLRNWANSETSTQSFTRCTSIMSTKDTRTTAGCAMMCARPSCAHILPPWSCSMAFSKFLDK